MNNESLFASALGLEDPWYIQEVKFSEEEKRLDIFINFKRGAVFPSPDPAVEGTFKAYDTKEKTWRHLNFFEHECFLHCRTPRVDIGNGKVLSVIPPWSGNQPGFTLLFEALVIQLCQHMPVATVARVVKCSDDKLWRLLGRYVDKALEQADLSKLEAIGMDETSVKKGHQYITLFVDLKNRKTVHIAEGKAEPVVQSFVQALESSNGNASQITAVSCDMSPAFISGVTKNLPNAKITFDRFHIMKMLNEAVDQVRREEAREQPLLKKARWAVLKNYENLTEKQKQKRWQLEMSKLNLKTMRAVHIRENFQAIYNAVTVAEFIGLLMKWHNWAVRSRLKPIIKVAKTIKSHWDGIISWKLSQINNGILEGLNSVVQAAKAKARGYRTFQNFKIITFLLTGKLNFRDLNPTYYPLPK